MDEQANQPGAEPSIEDRMLAIIKREEAPPESEEQPAVEAQPETEGQTETEAAQTEGEAEPAVEAQAEAEPEYEDITYKGEKKRLSKDELRELAQKGFDYTQKTMDLAEQRRAYEAERQAFQENQKAVEQYLDAVATVRAIDAQISQMGQIDWQALYNADPAEYTRQANTFRDLKDMRTAHVQQIEAKQRQDHEAMQRDRAKRIAETVDTLKRDIKGWDDSLRAKLEAYGREIGYSNEELSNKLDAKDIKLMHKAYLYDQLQKSKPILDKKVASAPPVVKPGAKTQADTKVTRSQELMSQLKKSGRVEDAAAFFLNRMR